jgi:hypothetical protein
MDYKDVVQLLERRGVTVDRIADIVMDELAERRLLPEPLQSITLMKRSLSVLCMYMV